MNHLEIFFEAVEEDITLRRKTTAFKMLSTTSLYVWEQMRFKTLLSFDKPRSIFLFRLDYFYVIYSRFCEAKSIMPLTQKEIVKALYSQTYYIGYVRGVKYTDRFPNRSMSTGYAIDVQKYYNQKNNRMETTTTNQTDFSKTQGEHMLRYGMFTEDGKLHTVNDDGKVVSFSLPTAEIREYLNNTTETNN